MAKNNKASLEDFIIYIKDTNLHVGKVNHLLEDSRIQVETYNDSMESTGEEDILEEEDLICNLFSKPMLGLVYGKSFKTPPKKVRMEGHEVFIYFPKEMLESEEGVDTTPYIDALQKAFDLIQSIKSSFCDKEYEIHIREGEPHKSSFKKSKKDFDGCLDLQIRFVAPDTTANATITSFSQELWKFATKESKSDWLKIFADDLLFEKLANTSFSEKFMSYLSEDDKTELEPEDEIICKLLVKEIKRVKCLSFKELKLLTEVNGEAYINEQIMPEVVNSVRLKDGIRINPLTGVTALKKFSSELTSYILIEETRPNNRFESTLRMFFDY